MSKYILSRNLADANFPPYQPRTKEQIEESRGDPGTPVRVYFGRLVTEEELNEKRNKPLP